MDSVVIGTFAAVAGTIIVGLYLGYKFLKIIMSKDDPE